MNGAKEIIKCLVVDDAALMRAMIKHLLDACPDIEVIGTADSGPVAIKKIKEHKPDVVTMDIEMPGMDGIALLRQVMKDHPVPVVMVSSHTQTGAQKTLEAMEAGAVDYVAKPSGVKGANLPDIAEILIAKIKQAAQINMAALKSVTADQAHRAGPACREVRPCLHPQDKPSFSFDADHIVAIGISCGGPASLVEVLPQLPNQMPPILITQHMPEGFTNSFSQRLNRLIGLEVREAKEGDQITPKRILIAPGEIHMTVQRKSGKLIVKLDKGAKVCGHRPSVDKLFRSVAKACGANCTAVIMTGMGHDGADAIGEIQRAGGLTIAQDQDSCIVYGMPKAAIERGNIDKVVPLGQVVPTVIESLSVPI